MAKIRVIKPKIVTLIQYFTVSQVTFYIICYVGREFCIKKYEFSLFQR